jgi:hypothetical protein
MAVLTVQNVANGGLSPAYVAASAGGDEIPNDGDIMLHVKVAATATTVTIASPNTCDQGGTHPLTIGPLTNTERMIGPFPPKRFNATDGNVDVSYSQVVGVTVAAIKLPPQ